MKLITTLFLTLVTAVSVSAQPITNTSVTGTININRGQPVVKGAKDVYLFNINVCSNALFRGTITNTLQIIDGWVSKTVVQPCVLDYNIQCDVINPKVPLDVNSSRSVRNVGKMYGKVKVTSEGIYQYNEGSLVVDILPTQKTSGFSTKFSGLALGKPLARPSDWLTTLKRETVNITRSVNGKTTVVALKKYDKMEFRQHVIAAGPVESQTSTVNGEMLYDYDKECWFFNNMNLQYVEQKPDGSSTIRIDRIGGTIRWVKSQTGGEYQFDVRVNEPISTSTAAFESKVNDVSDFFESDNTIPAVNGTMKYNDTVVNGVVRASSVTVNLNGNNINSLQTTIISKVILFSCVVPMNSD